MIKDHTEIKNDADKSNKIAIIGIGLNISSARNIDEYWDIVSNKINCIVPYPEERKELMYDMIKYYKDEENADVEFYHGSYMSGIDEFDYEYFQMSPREASLTEPVHRLFLQTILQTFDDAGYSDKKLKKSKTGVFVGYAASNLKDNYITNIFLNHKDLLPYSVVGNMAPLLASRASQFLDLNGPTMIMDTACSSSLLAIHQACESIRSGTCEMAIAGGAKLNMFPMIDKDTKLGIEALDGKTRTFDNLAAGTVNGEGVAAILLKSLEAAERDGDSIYAVIDGSAINHDGTASGITAPNPAAQTQVIVEAWKKAGIDPRKIDYIESHGTATALGDPIEIQGVTKAFEQYTKDRQFCAISGVKGNLGHLFECAGVVSVIKAVCALRNHKIPPTLFFQEPNANINFVDSPVYVNSEIKDWIKETEEPRICGVSAFGLSGTNCHIVLEEYKKPKKEQVVIQEEEPTICCYSAKCEESLLDIIKNNLKYIKAHENLDLKAYCYNMNVNRSLFELRICIIAKDYNDLIHKLEYIACNGLECQESNIYYNRVEKLSGDLKTRREQKKQYAQLTQVIKDACTQGTTQMSALQAIADAFVRGGEITWEEFYQGYRCEKLHLPPYPFKKMKAWLPKTQYQSKKANFFYQKIWVKKPIVSTKDSLNEVALIALGTTYPVELKNVLTGKGANVHEFICDSKQENMERFKDEILTLVKSKANVVMVLPHLFEEGITSYEDMVMFQENSLMAFTKLDAWFEEENIPGPISVSLIGDSSFEVTKKEERLKPENTTLYGYGKCVRRENRNVSFRFIDIETKENIQDAVNELFAKDQVEVVAYRDGFRYVEGLTESNVATKKQITEPLIRPEGVYLVTGGLGGIGFETAKQIARLEPSASLLIINRTVLPKEAEEEGFTTEDKELQEKVERYHTLKGMAKKVLYVAADISDPITMKRVVAQARQTLGPIKGVIHAAGLGGGVPIRTQTLEDLKVRIDPKIYGAWVLDDVTREDELDFFIMFSSISTVFSSTELSAYIAGNSYLDYFCDYRNRYRSGRSYTVNWATWCETGMSIKHEFTYDTLFKVITIENGIRSLFEVMSQTELSNVIIGELNLESNVAFLLPTYSIELSDHINRCLKALKGKDSKQNAVRESTGEVKVTGDSTYREIEIVIAKACQQVLGYDEIDINDSFFELGADSILMGRIFELILKEYPDKLEITDMFAYPSIRQLAEYISSKGVVTKQRSEESQKRITKSRVTEGKDIAIVGVGLTFPCANNLEEYWEILSNGICAVRNIPEERSKYLASYLRTLGMSEEEITFAKMAYLDEVDKFDYELFGMSPREAMLIDPINRIFLQTCWKALEDSGYAGERLRGSNTGVFLGYTANFGNQYSRLLNDIDPGLFGESLPVNQVSMAASRIAYVNDLKGPTMVIDTACSSSLVCVHMACESIRSGNCDMALAGGVSSTLLPLDGGPKVGFESTEDKTRAFSEDSNGTAVGEGSGVLLLKPLDQALEDHDHIYAVIKGSAINQDGSSFGIAAPNYLAQAEVIQKAWQNAGIDPDTISYVEAHGTGTKLGDPIEVRGLTEAFTNYTDKKQFCAFGSVKTNVGHMNEASGVSGLMKLILMFNHREQLPSLHFLQPNPSIDFINSPLFLVTKRQPWITDQPVLRAGINGFGMSGTNCHIILEEPPKQEVVTKEDDQYVIVLSSQYEEGLKIECEQLEKYIKENMETASIGSIAYTLQTGRKHLTYRIAMLVQSLEDLKDKLEQLNRSDITSLQEDWLYYGQYAIVSENKKEREAYEMTAQESKALNERALRTLQAIAEGKKDAMLELIQAYVKGAEIDWLGLYEAPMTKTSLPTYPFQKKHCWADVMIGDVPVAQMPEFDQLYFQNTWVEYSLGDYKKNPSLTCAMVMGYENDTLEEAKELLNRKDIEVITVLYGAKFKQITENQYICGNCPEDVETLFTCLKDRKINSLTYFTPYERAIKEYADIQACIEHGLFGMMNLIRGMVKAHYNQEMEILIVSYDAYGITGKETELCPHNAIALSIGKVIEQEYPHLSCRAIDADFNTSMSQIVDEIIQPDHKQYIVAYRDGLRYAQIFDKADVKAERVMLRPNGNYVITGGIGDIGLETALHLSKQGCHSITLLSRHGFYKKDEWDDLQLNDYEQNKLNILKEIESNGTLLKVAKVDVCDYEQLDATLCEIRKEFGPIHGVIHSAGLAGAGYILRKENEVAQKVLDPKVKGTWNLDQLTKDDSLDFMLLFSSAVTSSGEAGQSDYVAANSYLDAYCDYRNAMGRNTFTINWVSWKETGMSVRFGINFDTITRAIPTALAIEGLDTLLKSDHKHVTIGQYTISQNMLVMDEYARSLVSDAIKEKLKLLRETLDFDVNGDMILKEGKQEVAQIHNGKVRILPHSEKDKTSQDMLKNLKISVNTNDLEEVEANLVQVYCAVLGYEDIDIYDNFFEMGGDSIILTRMQGFIDQIYPNQINVADLFEYTSVYSLSQYLYEKINEGDASEDKCEEWNGMDGLAPYLDAEMVRPLSYAQRRVYISHKMSKDKRMYNNPFACRILSGITKEQHEEVMRYLIHRHEILRTGFVMQGKDLVQKVFAEDEIELPLEFMTVHSESDIDYNELLTAFNLAKPPLFKVTVITVEEGETILFVDCHHIIVDGYSSRLLNKEMTMAFSKIPLPEQKYQYRHYTKYEEAFSKSETYKKMKEYWAKRLKDFEEKQYLSPCTELNEKYPVPFIQTLDKSLMGEIEQMAKECKTTPFVLLLTAYAVVLHAYSKCSDICIGISVMGRNNPDVMTVMGMFVNILPIRSDIDDSMTMQQVINTAKQNVMMDLQNQLYPYNEMVKEYNQTVEHSIPDLVRVLFEYESQQMDLQYENENEIDNDDIVIPFRYSKYDMCLQILYKNETPYIRVEYDGRLYNEQFIVSFTRHYIGMLNHMVTDKLSGSIEEYCSKIRGDKL